MHFRNHSFLGGREICTGIYMLYTSQSLQWVWGKVRTAQDAASLYENKRWERSRRRTRGEVSRQHSGQGRGRWMCWVPPSSSITGSFSARGESGYVMGLSVVSRHPAMHHWVKGCASGMRGKMLGLKKNLVLTDFSACKYCDCGCTC